MGKDQELLEAARNGNIPVVEKILSQRAKRSGPLASLRRGPGANVQDNSGYSALHHAALNGHKEVVQLLLAHEASTNILDAKGSSPLHLAAWTGNVDIVRLLLCHGPSVPNVNLTTKDNETALHCAAQYGHTAVVSQLLEHSCDPTIRNSREETALDLAAQYGRLETVELLVRTHPELIQPYSRGHVSLFRHTPLHLASRNGHKAVVAVLLAAGLDVNVRTAGGTALHEAALCGKVEVVRTLLDGGVDLGIRDSQHNTVMDLLGQFPAHVTHDITAIIKKHRSSGMRDNMDPEDRDGLGNPLPPIPVPDSTLGSPYENVRTTRIGSRMPHSGGGGMDSSSPSTSPTHWEFYHSTKAHQGSSGDPTSVMSDSGVYQTPPAPKSLDSSFLSDDLSLFHHHQQQQRDPDQMSVSSTTSSTGGPSPRDRRCEAGSAGIYMPMAPGHGHSHSHSHSPGSSSKVSPTPPKKPPRRNLSVSPTHLQPTMTMSADSGAVCGSGVGAYEYLFLARSGVRSHGDLEDLQCLGTQTLGGGRRDALLRHQGRSVDQYVHMKLRDSIRLDQQHQQVVESFHTLRGRSEDIDDSLGRKHLVKEQPVAITSMYENFPIKTQNPRRKLRRHPHNDRAYENFEPTQHRAVASEAGKTVSPSAPVVVDTSESVPEEDNPTFVSSAYITLKSSQESLLDEPNGSRRHSTTPTDGSMMRVQVLPLSPTHYQQPPTPDHPPPSALQAEKSIHERIRPLSQEYKRRSRDIETETEEDLLLFPSLDASSGSLSSSISLSDKSVSTDNNVEEFFGDAPFAGLLKGSTSQGPDGGPRSSPAERPKTLRRLKNVYDTTPGTNGSAGKFDDGEEAVAKRPSAPCSRSAGSGTGSGSGIDKSQCLSILSPFDEQEEWAKISEIMASFGTGLVRESVFVSELEKEFQNRLGMTRSPSGSPVAGPGCTGGTSSIGQWLGGLGLADYESLFYNNGFDDLDFISGVLEDQDLKEMGIDNEKDREAIMESARNLPCKIHQQQSTCLNINNNNNNNNNITETPEKCGDGDDEEKSTATDSAENEGHDDDESAVDRWLTSIRLGVYKETFRKHLYTDMERVRRIWEVELTAVLEIQRVGHRKRILASVSGHQSHGSHGPNIEDINADLNLLKSNIQQLKEEIREKLPVVPNTGTLRHSHKKSRPAPQPPMSTNGSGGGSDLEIREPSELLVGVPATLTTQWRHRPRVLVSGSVSYVASYLGSTVVKELRGTESTKKSIQKLKKSSSTRDAKATPDVILAISYRGVKFLNTVTKELVCEHEIRNIHCACQDADDLTHFAYITKDHASKSHYCHVFCVQTMDQATEVILTLGQAFEVAYQMALRDQFAGGRGGSNNNGGCHVRSQSATHILTTPNISQSGTNPSGQSNHFRSLSVNEIKVNGQDKTRDVSPSHQLSPSDKEVHDDGQNPTSGDETTDVRPAASKGNQVTQAPIVVTEEL